MSTLFFDIMNSIYDDPDWSELETGEIDPPDEDDYSEESGPDSCLDEFNGIIDSGNANNIPFKVELAYRQVEKPSKKPFKETYNWLKPPEDWKKSEANRWNLT